MQTKQLRGILLSVGFVVGTTVGYTALLRMLPSEWFHPIPPPYDLPLIFSPVAVITFFAARKIDLNSVVFGVIALAVTFFLFAGVLGIRGYNDSLFLPLFLASNWTAAFLAGFLGQELRQQRIRRKRRAGQ